MRLSFALIETHKKPPRIYREKLLRFIWLLRKLLYRLVYMRQNYCRIKDVRTFKRFIWYGTSDWGDYQCSWYKLEFTIELVDRQIIRCYNCKMHSFSNFFFFSFWAVEEVDICFFHCSWLTVDRFWKYFELTQISPLWLLVRTKNCVKLLLLKRSDGKNYEFWLYSHYAHRL